MTMRVAPFAAHLYHLLFDLFHSFASGRKQVRVQCRTYQRMVMGIYWRRTSRQGVVSGMLLGLGVTMYYMVVHSTTVQSVFSWSGHDLWFGIQPISAGVFGVPAGFLAIWVVSLLFPDRRLPQAGPIEAQKSL